MMYKGFILHRRWSTFGNSLPRYVVVGYSVNELKSQLDTFRYNQKVAYNFLLDWFHRPFNMVC